MISCVCRRGLMTTKKSAGHKNQTHATVSNKDTLLLFLAASAVGNLHGDWLPPGPIRVTDHSVVDRVPVLASLVPVRPSTRPELRWDK